MPSEQPGQPAILIPAYRPSAGLVDLVAGLSARGVSVIVLVDDGSGPEFRATFDAAAQIPGVHLLRHAVNLGKGAALKTGINHILCAFPDLPGIVTADADGQHHPEDILRAAAALQERPNALVLGARTFDGAVPLRSRFGNVLTRRLMHALIGANLQDTQTGLRAIPAAFAARLLLIDARGYEFELEMLIAAHQNGVEFHEIPIRTIYEPGNQSSHFNPLADSMKIYFVLLRFSSVSLMAALLDNLIFYLVWKRSGHILGAQVAARAVSVAFGYTMARARVFASRESHRVLLPRYLLLVVASGTASYLGIRYFTARLGISAMPVKLVMETLLFFVNFAVQRLLIFRGRSGNGEAGTTTAATSRAARFAAARLYAWLILAAFAAIVAVELSGFRTSHLFSQLIWDPEGIARLLRFTVFFTAAATAVSILVPWLLVPLAVVLLAAMTVIGIGPLAFAAVAFFLLSAWSLGSVILAVGGGTDHRFPWSVTPGLRSAAVPDSPAAVAGPGEPSGTPHVLTLLLGLSVYIFFMPFVARLPINYPAVYAAILALPVLANRARLRSAFAAIPHLPARVELRTWGERFACAALLFVVATHWFAMLKPEASADGLSMHLAVPVNIAARHVLTFEPSRFLWAVMPMGADFSYTIVYLLGGEMASRLLNFAFLLILLALIYSAVRPRVSPATAWWLAALFATSPLVQLVTGSLFVENLLAALVLGSVTALWLFGESGQRRWLYLAAVLGGTAMAVKFGALSCLVPAILCAAVEVWLRRKSRPRAALALLLFLLAAAPPYTIAWAKTGNPLFPFLHDRIHSPLLDPKAQIKDLRFREPLTWTTPYDVTFSTHRFFEAQDGTFGFQYLLLAPLALGTMLVAARRRAITGAAAGLTACIVVLNSEPNIRYLYPALPLLLVPFGSLLGWAARHRPALCRSLIAFTIAAAALNVYFLAGSSYYHKDLWGPFTPAQRSRYLGTTAPIRDVIAWFNRAHPHAPVLLTQDSTFAGLDGEVYEGHWHQYNMRETLRQAQGVPGLRAVLGRWNVRYLIARKPTATSHASPAALRVLLDECTLAEYIFDDFYVARVEPVCRADATQPVEPIVTAAPGIYDDLDPAILLRGDWVRSNEFDRTFLHTVSYTDAPGAEVRFAFRGTSLRYVFTRAANRGIAAIAIDGTSYGSLDLYAPQPEWQSSATFEHLGPGRHLLVIRVTGESRPAATGTFVDLDGLEVR